MALVTELEDDCIEDESDPLVYPSIEMSGVTLLSELQFLHNRPTKGKEKLPLFINFDGIVKRIGSVEFSLDTFQICHYVNPDYKLVLHKTPTESVDLDLDDVSTYLKVLRIA